MRLKKNKVTMSLFIFMLTNLVLGGCDQREIIANSENTIDTKIEKRDTPGWQIDTSPITFNWLVNLSWYNSKWGEDLTSQYVTKKTGVNINFITPSNDTGDSLSTLIANEELPDFITIENWDPAIKTLIDNDLVYALDELAEKYDTYFTKVTHKQKLDWYREENGHVYQYPNSSITIEDFEANKDSNTSNQTFLVRKDIYEAIGKPDMRTPEGFINALIKAKEMFPMVNSEELIPIGLHSFIDIGNYSLQSYLQNFLAIPYEKDGKLYDRFKDEEYIKWLKVFRKANELGLLSSDIFIDTRLQIEEKISQGRYFALMYQSSDMVTPQLELFRNDKNKVYIAVDGPANSNMDAPRLESSDKIGGWTVTLISKNCKDPERAIRFLSYLISEEGNKDLFLGEEGVTWELVNGKEQFKTDVQELLTSDRLEFNRIYGAAHTFWMLMDNNITRKWESESKGPLDDIENWTKGKTFNYSVYEHISPDENSEEGIADKKIWELWGRTLFNLITAESDEKFDEIFNQFVIKRDELGYENVWEYQQNKVIENKKKLSIGF